jgi:hypothetical protein
MDFLCTIDANKTVGWNTSATAVLMDLEQGGLYYKQYCNVVNDDFNKFVVQYKKFVI